MAHWDMNEKTSRLGFTWKKSQEKKTVGSQLRPYCYQSIYNENQN